MYLPIFVEFVKSNVLIILALDKNRLLRFSGLSTVEALAFSLAASLLLTVTGPSTLKIIK